MYGGVHYTDMLAWCQLLSAANYRFLFYSPLFRSHGLSSAKELTSSDFKDVVYDEIHILISITLVSTFSIFGVKAYEKLNG